MFLETSISTFVRGQNVLSSSVLADCNFDSSSSTGTKMPQENDEGYKEKSNIDELRRRMKDLMTSEMYEDDNVFERFLRARNQNLDAAETMLKNHIRWRKIHRIDTIRKEYTPLEVIVKYDVMSRIAFDKEGTPVILASFGNLDIRGVFKCCNRNDFFKYLIQHLEEYVDDMKEKSKELGKPINQWIMVFDYTNFTFANATYKPTIQYMLTLMSMYEANYPERLKSAYCINGSVLFQICFAMFKPFFTGATYQKINFFGSDYSEALLKIIDADELPAFLGGNRTDPDGNPRCEQTVKLGGVIPEYYYVMARNRKLSVIPGARLLVIRRFSKAKLEVEVSRPGSTIEWRYTVKNKNIDFSVFYKDPVEEEDEKWEEVIPKQRVETLVSSENGMCLCEKAGVYILEFDNSYSWLYSKYIYYDVDVINPPK